MAPNPPPGNGPRRPARPGPAGPTSHRAGAGSHPEAAVEITGEVGAPAAAAVLALADAAARADGISPLSEQVRLRLRHGTDRAERHLLLWQGAGLAGYAHLSAPGPDGSRGGELVVHPASRGRGLGRVLARAAVSQAKPAAEPGHAGPGSLRIWAHGDLPGAARLAEATGFRRVRALWMMRRPLAGALAEPRFPAGVTVRTFVPGEDERQWLAVNARAFASHPEQGTWTMDDLLHREREPWFDPAGFFLAERGGKLAGFHWTKVHPPGVTHRQAGEVYVVGVDPSEQGTGLGRAITLAGLWHLREQGVPDVMLYVDEDNQSAVRLYQSLGFTHTATDIMYEYRDPATA